MQQQGSKTSHHKEIEQLREEIKLLKNLMPVQELEKLRAAAEKEIRLDKNYPDPFYDQTTVRYFVPQMKSTRVSIFVVDNHGKQHLHFDHLETGGQKIEIENHNLKPGFYYYSLVIDGNIILTRKMELKNA